MTTASARDDKKAEERPISRETFARWITRMEFGRFYQMGRQLSKAEQRTPADIRELRKRGIAWRRAQ
jgi:hypothetical protein